MGKTEEENKIRSGFTQLWVDVKGGERQQAYQPFRTTHITFTHTLEIRLTLQYFSFFPCIVTPLTHFRILALISFAYNNEDDKKNGNISVRTLSVLGCILYSFCLLLVDFIVSETHVGI